MSRPVHLEAVPDHRKSGARAVADAMLAAKKVVLTTHVNAATASFGSPITG